MEYIIMHIFSVGKNILPVRNVEPSHIIGHITVKVQQCGSRPGNHFWHSPNSVVIFVHQPTVKTRLVKSNFEILRAIQT